MSISNDAASRLTVLEEIVDSARELTLEYQNDLLMLAKKMALDAGINNQRDVNKNNPRQI